MKRRDFLKSIGIGLTATLATAHTNTVQSEPIYNWKMVTSWPKNFPGLGTGAEFLAKLINEMSGGRISIKVYGGGELVPPMEIFDTVSRGAAEMGHGAAYYWKGKHPAFQFFSTVPFGMTATEMNAWLYKGGGMELWEKAYSAFNLVPTSAGNSGVQMGGWFNKEINSLEDLKGLKMRIPGLGGEVLRRAGGIPVNLPGGELLTSLKSGVIDATEWVNPYNDLAFGLHQAAKYYYYPGWHEPGTTIECFINKNIFDSIPDDLKHIVLNASRVANQDMLCEYVARNNDALRTLVDKHNVDIREYPKDVIEKLRHISTAVVSEVAQKDALAGEIYASYSAFLAKVKVWQDISERAYLNARVV